MADDKQQIAEDKLDQEISGSELDHADCEQRTAEFETKYKRALADYQNLERQTAEHTMRFAKLATKDFVEQLIKPYDHLLLASKHVKDKGLDMVITQFKQVFESQGLREINPVGKPFDPQTMEAIDTKEGKEDTVIEVMSVGYELNGIVIKPAQVIVGTKSK
jgi:molecular chaperone GrpE